MSLSSPKTHENQCTFVTLYVFVFLDEILLTKNEQKNVHISQKWAAATIGKKCISCVKIISLDRFIEHFSNTHQIIYWIQLAKPKITFPKKIYALILQQQKEDQMWTLLWTESKMFIAFGAKKMVLRQINPLN